MYHSHGHDELAAIHTLLFLSNNVFVLTVLPVLLQLCARTWDA